MSASKTTVRVAACLLAAAAAATFASFAQIPPQVTLVNEAGLPKDAAERLQADLDHWGRRVYRHLAVDSAPPVKTILTRRVPIGYYSDGVVFLPVSTRLDMIETWVHELAHHVTGHDSSFF